MEYGGQSRFLIKAVFSFPWDRFLDQGERVFEVVLFVLWFAFVAFLAFSAIRIVRESAKKKPVAEGNDVIFRHPQRAVSDRWQRPVTAPSNGSVPMNSLACKLRAACRLCCK